ncbi:MAG: alpha/beta fold hydrolase [Flavobacteriales bacterium]
MNPNTPYLFNHGSFTLEYRVYKGGDDVLLAFHGYGKSMNDMEEFHDVLKEKYTIYAFNFFHHGNSVYPGDRIKKNTLLPGEWNTLMEEFLKEKNIPKFSLFGYSMGGKLCLEMLVHFRKQIKSVYLLAPDGLKTNFWYALTSRNRFGNTIYRALIKNPKPFFAAVSVLRFIRLLNKNLYRFVKTNLSTRERRQMVYDVWMTMRHFKPSLQKIGNVIREDDVKLYVLLGKYDKVIPAKLNKKVEKHIPVNCMVYIVDCGHNLIVPETVHTISEILKKETY